MDIAVDQFWEGYRVIFLLDDNGNVWASKNLFSYFKLENLRNIIKLAPYIAVDKDGQVFTWALDKKTKAEEEELNPVYTVPKRVEGIRGATQIAYSDYHFVVVQDNRDIMEWNSE
jgi:alpha-tubulin suppressor-like RCC1 family protein